MELEDVAKNHLDSDKVELILEQATQCELMVVFKVWSYHYRHQLDFNFMVFEESGSSFGQPEWMAHPWDSLKGLYDYVSSFVIPHLGSEENLRVLSLYQMPNEDYFQLQKAGKLEPIQLQKTMTLLLDLEAPLWKIGLSNLIFAFTVKWELHIPYALFDG
ncbi:uncharacterized protein EI90DRAFT_3021241 [Cantharellus anzutake]|uniref:uncharacterized protein n=1 Tax=Cantharellus anzutake TaxID=1750568 RepID=UPI001908482F|nr:uncharacterized protein EI90DRAFT_3021241 [Cantharellus anzutake]KAF8317841.1 hypothetical protein EI90DRAFT_3021241 [Cantharellus anzutake]